MPKETKTVETFKLCHNFGVGVISVWWVPVPLPPWLRPGLAGGGFKGYIVPGPGPRGTRKSSGFRVKIWYCTKGRI